MVRKQLFLANWLLGALSDPPKLLGGQPILCLGLCFVKKHQTTRAPCHSHHLLLTGVAHNSPHTTSILVPQQNPLITRSCAAISTSKPGVSATPKASNLRACWLLYLTSVLLLKSFFQGEKFGSTISIFPGDGSATTENSWVVELLRWLFCNLPV